MVVPSLHKVLSVWQRGKVRCRQTSKASRKRDAHLFTALGTAAEHAAL